MGSFCFAFEKEKRKSEDSGSVFMILWDQPILFAFGFHGQRSGTRSVTNELDQTRLVGSLNNN